MKRISSYFLVFTVLFYSGCNEENPPAPIIEEDEEDVCYIAPGEDYLSCVKEKDSLTFDIATWNIQQFPKTNNTLTALEELITNFQADLLAVQEITDDEAFNELDQMLPNWEAELVVSSGLNIGFLYNTCEILEVSSIKEINIGDNYSFPRKPVEVTVTHKNGIRATLINIHLKCCDDGYERRIAASTLLKEYIDDNYPDDNVILLGDFNDHIKDDTSPFSNFINSQENYNFTDRSIALGPTSEYSFPGYPSHIDHILVTNELFDNINYTEVVKFENCYSTYKNIISDHRPVLLSLSPDN